ncbi:ferric reductase like transmembrane component-domain-containing protein [Melampsora americana]|nr:ferric reductase like transmembrane component-domain-containing protein [Melampsora americana]
MSDAPPMPEGGFTVYDSYTIDPIYANYFTYVALGILALGFLTNLPGLYQSVKTQTLFHRLSLTGLRYRPKAFHPLSNRTEPISRTSSKPLISLLYLQAISNKILLPNLTFNFSSLRFTSRLNLSNLFLILLIPALVFGTLFPKSDLSDNPNRAGFLALATLPWIFFLGGKSTGLSSWIGLSYDHLNYLHRWIGRVTLSLVLIHFGLWTTQFSKYGSKYLSERLSGTKESRGIMSLCFLFLLSLPSLSFFRHLPIFGWKIFKSLHVIGFIGFIIGINMHTTYAWRWTVGVIVIYAVDVTSRTIRYRFKTVQIEALEGGVTRLRIQGVTDGWRAGQHLRIRLFFPIRSRRSCATIWSLARPLESHPLSISHGPESASVADTGGSLVLFCSSGRKASWTSDLWEAAEARPGMVITGLIDGPYGGLPTHASIYENQHLLLLAGGSGMSFIMGMLDEAVSATVMGSRGCFLETISMVWCVRDPAIIEAYMPMMENIMAASRSSGQVTVRVVIYVKTSDETIPEEKSNVIVRRGRCKIDEEIQGWIQPEEKLGRDIGGGRTIVVCGRDEMIADARNSVARIPVDVSVRAGGITLYTEHFGL